MECIQQNEYVIASIRYVVLLLQGTKQSLYLFMLKSTIRKQALAQRKALTHEQADALNKNLLARFIELDFNDIKTIHIFLPIVENNEPNTFLLIDWLRQNHPEIQIFVPKADFETHEMTHHLYTGKTNLVKSNFNILEPNSEPITIGKIDLVFVPLLAFDTEGHRVGYGKGFYDRFLKSVEAKKIGISFFEPVEGIADVHEKDIKLDICLTPQKIYILL